MTIEWLYPGCMLEEDRMELGSGSDEQALLPCYHIMPRVTISSSPRVLTMMESG